MWEQAAIEERLVTLCDELEQQSTAVQHRFADDVAEQVIDSLNSLTFNPPIETSRRALEVKRRYVAGKAGRAELKRAREALLAFEQSLPLLLPTSGQALLEQCVGVFYASTRVFSTVHAVLSEREQWLLKWDIATLLLESAGRAASAPLTDEQRSFAAGLQQFVMSGLACIQVILIDEPLDAARRCTHTFVEHHHQRARLKLLAEQLTMTFCPLRRGDNNLPAEARLRWANGRKGIDWLQAWLHRERTDSAAKVPLRRHRSTIIVAGAPPQ